MGNVARFANAIGAVALISGCGGSQLPIGAPGAMPGLRGVSDRFAAGSLVRDFVTLFSFDQSDGAYPVGGLLDVNGTLYGTTRHGGSGCGNYGCGTVFSISTTGEERVLYSFAGSPDGYYPNGGLIDVKGTLYGTTAYGGSSGVGTVFAITIAGKEKVIYSFAGSPDGATPFGGLLDVKGRLYGATSGGGASNCRFSGYSGCGVIYGVTTKGSEKVLYSFTGQPDGANPEGPLAEVKGTLYGTTTFGGSNYSNLCYESQCGIVFAITTAGKEKVLFSFDSSDGADPNAGLLNVGGILYGTTFSGGNYCTASNTGCGVVFNITTAGKETVLYNFGGKPDGAWPNGGLLDVDGTLYGTTGIGGMHGNGTVYSISTAGVETVIHSFGHRSSGPSKGSLIDVKGRLYGTTSGGYRGTGLGYGTVFTLKP